MNESPHSSYNGVLLKLTTLLKFTLLTGNNIGLNTKLMLYFTTRLLSIILTIFKYVLLMIFFLIFPNFNLDVHCDLFGTIELKLVLFSLVYTNAFSNRLHLFLMPSIVCLMNDLLQHAIAALNYCIW